MKPCLFVALFCLMFTVGCKPQPNPGPCPCVEPKQVVQDCEKCTPIMACPKTCCPRTCPKNN